MSSAWAVLNNLLGKVCNNLLGNGVVLVDCGDELCQRTPLGRLERTEDDHVGGVAVHACC